MSTNAERLFSDPDGFLKEYGDKIRAEVFEEVTKAYAADKSQTAYWDEFGKSHPDLKSRRAEAQEVLGNNYQKWVDEGISVEQSFGRIADHLNEQDSIRIGQQYAKEGRQYRVQSGEKEMFVDSQGKTRPTMGQVIRERQAKFNLNYKPTGKQS